jgi:hypothetical protein
MDMAFGHGLSVEKMEGLRQGEAKETATNRSTSAN